MTVHDAHGAGFMWMGHASCRMLWALELDMLGLEAQMEKMYYGRLSFKKDTMQKREGCEKKHETLLVTRLATI